MRNGSYAGGRLAGIVTTALAVVAVATAPGPDGVWADEPDAPPKAAAHPGSKKLRIKLSIKAELEIDLETVPAKEATPATGAKAGPAATAGEAAWAPTIRGPLQLGIVDRPGELAAREIFYERVPGTQGDLAVIQGDIVIGKVDTLNENLRNELGNLARGVERQQKKIRRELSDTEVKAIGAVQGLVGGNRSVPSRPDRPPVDPEIEELAKSIARLPEAVLEDLGLDEGARLALDNLRETGEAKKVVADLAADDRLADRLKAQLKDAPELRARIKQALGTLADRAIAGKTRSGPQDNAEKAAGVLRAAAGNDELQTDFDRLAALASVAPLDSLGLTEEQKKALTLLGKSAPESARVINGSPFLVPSHPDSTVRGFFRPTRQYRWKDNVVPYDDTGVGSDLENKIKLAITHIQDKTAVTFVPRKPDQKDYVRFVASNLNNSLVGRQGGQQIINLQTTPPAPVGTVIHEIGHALGLWHEHTRPDRDKEIEIHLENVRPSDDPNHPDYNRRQFDKVTSEGATYGRYDKFSVMHYNGSAFGVDGKLTMTGKNGVPLPDEVGRLDDNKPLSPLDIGALAEIYGDKP
jgi:hypothetical protein